MRYLDIVNTSIADGTIAGTERPVVMYCSNEHSTNEDGDNHII